MLIYFAAPLFTQAERIWNRELVAALRAFDYQVFVPQEEAAPILEHGMDPARIFQTMIDGVKTADAVVAILDGPDPYAGADVGPRETQLESSGPLVKSLCRPTAVNH